MNNLLPHPFYAVETPPASAPVITNIVKTEPTQTEHTALTVRRAPAKPDAPEGLFPLFKGTTLEDSAKWISAHITGYSESYDDRTANVPRKLMNLTLRNKSDLIFANAPYSVETFCLKQEDRLIKGAKGELDGTAYRAQFMWFRVEQPQGFADCRYFKYNKAGFLVVEVRLIHSTNVISSSIASSSALLGTENQENAISSEQVELPTAKAAITEEDQPTLPKGNVKSPV